MPSSGDLMRKALRKELLPALKRLGFVGKTSDFQRHREPILDLLSIQWGRYGGEFILEFGSCATGPLQVPWGEAIAEAKITVVHVNPLRRARLVPAVPSQGTQLHGFFSGSFGEDATQYQALVSSVSPLLEQVVAWLDSGVVGPNIRPLGGTA
jgi:hypothetical protein